MQSKYKKLIAIGSSAHARIFFLATIIVLCVGASCAIFTHIPPEFFLNPKNSVLTGPRDLLAQYFAAQADIKFSCTEFIKIDDNIIKVTLWGTNDRSVGLLHVQKFAGLLLVKKELFISLPEFYELFPIFSNLTTSAEFVQIASSLPLGEINFCILLKKCFISGFCWADLPQTYKFITCLFLDTLSREEPIRILVDTRGLVLDVFFDFKSVKGCFDLVKNVVLAVDTSGVNTNLELNISMAENYFYWVDFYLELAENKKIVAIILDEFLNKICSSVYLKKFNPEWIVFYADTLEIYILWNWIPWSLAFVFIMRYMFRPNTSFYYVGMTIIPVANFFLLALYLFFLFYFNNVK